MKQSQGYSIFGKIILLSIVSFNILSAGEALAVRYGDNNESVAKIQQRLRDLGFFRGSVTGFFGIETDNAVRDYQRDCGIPVDGIVESRTSHHLFTIPSDCPNHISDGGGSPNYPTCQITTVGYVVVVPITHDGVVSKIFDILPNEACIEMNSRGNFVNAGTFGQYNYAQMRVLRLRQTGLDARVIRR
jgi:peptidoglycan hydrolase-like protein with peptidoglycan-binding domain